MELKETIPMMLSEDCKEQLKSEYYQACIRREQLISRLGEWSDLVFIPPCPRSTYDMQIRAMTDYIAVLEARAVMEGVDLH